MVSFFGRGGGSKQTVAGTEHASALSENERRILLVAATAALLTLALISLALSGKASGPRMCKGILLQSQRNSCFEALAGSTGNASLCSDINMRNQYNSCISYIAEAQSNAILCGMINRTDPEFDQCVLNISNATGNEGYCQMLNGTYQSSCTYGLAKAGGFSNISLCGRMTNITASRECDYLYYYSSALSSKSASYCSMLPSSANDTVLTLMLTKNITNATLTVQQMAFSALNTTPQNYCYYSIATQTGNASACSLTTGLLNELCRYQHSVNANATANTVNATNLTAACSEAPSALLKELCLSSEPINEAIGYKNISKCLQISNLSYQYECITAYAEKFVNASDCSRIGNSTVRYDCYYTVTNGSTGAT
jgi:hypothetical protein